MKHFTQGGKKKEEKKKRKQKKIWNRQNDAKEEHLNIGKVEIMDTT